MSSEQDHPLDRTRREYQFVGDVYYACSAYRRAAAEVNRAVRTAHRMGVTIVDLAAVLGPARQTMSEWLDDPDEVIVPIDPSWSAGLEILGELVLGQVRENRGVDVDEDDDDS